MVRLLQNKQDEVRYADLVFELRIVFPGFLIHSRLDDLFDCEPGLGIGTNTGRQSAMVVRELDAHHRPAALSLVEVAIQDHVLFLAVFGFVP